MKKKSPAQPPIAAVVKPPSVKGKVEQPVIAKEILEMAKLALEPELAARREKCVVCGTECAPNSSEGLCWICRRLKISAWRDNDTQMGAQE